MPSDVRQRTCFEYGYNISEFKSSLANTKCIMANKDFVERNVFKNKCWDAQILICIFNYLNLFSQTITLEKMSITIGNYYISLFNLFKLINKLTTILSYLTVCNCLFIIAYLYKIIIRTMLYTILWWLLWKIIKCN